MDTSNDVKEDQIDGEASKTSMSFRLLNMETYNSDSNSWMRGRGRGRHWQNRGRGLRGRGGYFPGQKRNYVCDLSLFKLLVIGW